MIDKKHLAGIGETQFMGANQIILNDEFAGLTLIYKAIHGGEDKKKLILLRDFRNKLLEMREDSQMRDNKRRNGTVYKKADGTTFENPLYSAWKETYLQQNLEDYMR